MTKPARRIAFAFAVIAVVVVGLVQISPLRLGKQNDGSFLVSTGQRIEGGAIPFEGRPIDLAIHPSGDFMAILNKTKVMLAKPEGVDLESAANLGSNAGFRGLIWSSDGSTLFASTDKGVVKVFKLETSRLKDSGEIVVKPADDPLNPVPGGMAINRAGTRLYVAAANRNEIVEIELPSRKRLRGLPVQNLPFEPRLTNDEKTLVVSNWGGRPPKPGERSAKSQYTSILVDERGAPASGTVSLINLESGETRNIDVGIHPTAILIKDHFAYAANAMSDSISEIDLAADKVSRTFKLEWQGVRVLGAMPNALAVVGGKLLAADGGDNAVCEIDLEKGKVLGYRPVGFFPTAIEISKDQTHAYVLNTKGNGSVARTILGKAGNAHDFQGTVSILDLSVDVSKETEKVASNNHWKRKPGKPPLAVYQGGVKHVLYIIKENRTYDEVFGDLPQGNGDAKLCSLGEKVMPNHRAIARQFTLFDNGYVSGTNSADGHAWSTQCLANDYLEHFYVGYSRTYPDDGDCAMSISNGGALGTPRPRRENPSAFTASFATTSSPKSSPRPRTGSRFGKTAKRAPINSSSLPIQRWPD